MARKPEVIYARYTLSLAGKWEFRSFVSGRVKSRMYPNTLRPNKYTQFRKFYV